MHSTRLLWAIVAVLCLTTLWSWVRPQSSEPQPAALRAKDSADVPSSSRLIERVETLEDELTREILLRQELERRLAMLERREPLRNTTAPTPDINGTLQAQSASTPASSIQQRPSPADDRSLAEKLAELGLPSDTAQRIQRRLDSNQLAMLELRNQAVREGWSDSAEFVERMHEMRNSSRNLREEFGDNIYERYLYASGQPNRIRVREVFSGSAADIAGIRAGDIVLSYATDNVFTMGELRKATTEGLAGENILVEVIRDGDPVSVNITRGPMGISMEMARTEPR